MWVDEGGGFGRRLALLFAAAFLLCRVPLVSLERFLFLVFATEERRGIWHVDNGGSQRHGAAGSRRWACDDGRAQDGGVVWRRGGVDGS